MRLFLSLGLAVCSVAGAQVSPVPPSPTATPSHPFFITRNWIIGGVGNWDYLTMDPATNELFIAHGPAVQVVSVSSGAIAGTVTGIREAHAIVLDEDGMHGYISDGPAAMVRVFDRRSFEVVANIPTGPAPRSMALDPPSGLLFVIGSQPGPANEQADGRGPTTLRTAPPRRASRPESTITVIDTAKRTQLAQVVLPGALGFAQADGNGRVYVTVSNRNQILRLDAQAIGSAVRGIIDAQRSEAKPQRAAPAEKPLILDWTPDAKPAPPADAVPLPFSAGFDCQRPRALAFDSAHARLFAACSNMKLVVLNAATGQTVTSLPIGPGTDAIGYDPNRGLIFTANGGGDGSVTIIRRDVTDTYSVIQTLPTRQHARTLAVNPSSGEVYLVSVIYGAALNSPPVSGATLKVAPIDSSFQVLVIGN